MHKRRSAMSIELTGDMFRDAGDAPVRVIDPDTKREYVLLRAEQYERLQSLVAVDDGDIRGAYPLMDAVAAREGWADAEMDEYDHYSKPKS
jgi:hypothetical protein